MANITLALPDSTYSEMQMFSEVKWSAVARRAISEKLEQLKIANEIAQKSKLTKTDVEKFNKKIKAIATNRLLE